MENTQSLKQDEAWRVGTSLLWIIVIGWCVASGLMLFGIAAAGWEALLAIAAGISIAAGSGRRNGRAPLIVLAATLGAAAISLFIPDASYDGNAYHQDAVALFMAGWNPVKNPIIDTHIWVLHYCKGAELTGAAFAALFGHLEQAKMVNVMLVLSAFFGMKGLLEARIPGAAAHLRVIAALIAVCCPPAIGQTVTFYTDLWVYYCVLWLLILLFSLSDGKASDPRHAPAQWLLMGGVTILAIATKWTAAFYMALAWLAAIIPFCRRGCGLRAVALILTPLVAATLGVFLFGWHPYVTNTLTASHPLYPLMGPGAQDIMEFNTPAIFANGNRLSNFFLSLAPTSFHVDYACPIGGFGAFIGLILMAAVGSLFLKGTPWMLRYAAGVALLSCFCFEQSWWARYIPQLWLVVTIGAVAALWRYPRSLAARCCFRAIALLAAFTMAAEIRTVIPPAIRLARERNEFVASLPDHKVLIAPPLVTPASVDPGRLPFGAPGAPSEGRFLPSAPAVERELRERGVETVYTLDPYSIPYFYWSGRENTNFAAAVVPSGRPESPMKDGNEER